MVNNPLIRPYFLGGVALGGVARIPLRKSKCWQRLEKVKFKHTLDIQANTDPDFGERCLGMFGEGMFFWA